MEEFESQPTAEKQNLGSRLATLEESVEHGIDALFMGYDLPATSVAKLVKVNESTLEIQIDRQKESRHEENEELAPQIETGIETVVSLKNEAVAVESIGQLLNTTDLPPMTDEQSHQVRTVLDRHPQIVAEKDITVEAATEFDFEGIDLVALAPVAEELGHTFFVDGSPDFQMLADPDEQFFLTTLGALVSSYDRGEETFPYPRFVDLPIDDMKVLFGLYRYELSNHHPHLYADANFKIPDLRRVAGDVLAKANVARAQADTDLFSKVITEVPNSR